MLGRDGAYLVCLWRLRHLVWIVVPGIHGIYPYHVHAVTSLFRRVSSVLCSLLRCQIGDLMEVESPLWYMLNLSTKFFLYLTPLRN